MIYGNKAFFPVKINTQSKDQGWEVLKAKAIVLNEAAENLLIAHVHALSTRGELGLDFRAKEAAVA